MAAAVFSIVALLTATHVTSLWDLPLRDALLRRAPGRTVTAVAAVTIDESSLASQGSWPWPRERLAALVRVIRAGGARLVVLDLLLAEAAAGDAALAAALAKGPTLLVAALADGGSAWILPAPSLRGTAEIGHAGFPLDHDGVLRRLATTQQAGGRSIPAVAVAAAARVNGTAVPIGRVAVPDFRAHTSDVPQLSAGDLLTGTANPEVLDGRAVFVGSSAVGLGDRVVTPTSPRSRPVPGVLVHAAVTEALLTGHVLLITPPWAAGGLALLVALAPAALVRLGGGRRVGAELALLSAVLLLGTTALLWAGVEMPIATLGLVALIAVGVSEARLAWLAWRHAGEIAALLSDSPSGETVPSAPGERLESVERLARSARLRQVKDEEARRVLAHELKTPLTSVRGLAQLLSEFDLAPDEQRRVAAMVGGEVDRLREMVDGILDLAHVDAAGRAAGPVDLASVALDRCAALSKGSGRAIECDTPPTVVVSGDRGLLERVLDNLVGNAIKYSAAPDPIEVRISVDQGEAKLEVRDAGKGIPAAELETIFGRFARGSSAAGTQGTGLGLALVDEVITWHRGRIEVESTEGAGSTFTVVLPLAATSPGG